MKRITNILSIVEKVNHVFINGYCNHNEIFYIQCFLIDQGYEMISDSIRFANTGLVMEGGKICTFSCSTYKIISNGKDSTNIEEAKKG